MRFPRRQSLGASLGSSSWSRLSVVLERDGLPGRVAASAGCLAAAFSHELSLEWTLSSWHRIVQQADNTCGTVVLLHAGLALGLFGLPTNEMIMDFHLWLVAHLALGLCQSSPWIFGFGPNLVDLQAQPAALLATKGVPSNAAADRAGAALKKLGTRRSESPFRDQSMAGIESAGYPSWQLFSICPQD